MAKVIRNGITLSGSVDPIISLTRAEYNALPSDKLTDGKIYEITDENAYYNASSFNYDNSTSGLTATNVQGAIDEVANGIMYSDAETICGIYKENGVEKIIYRKKYSTYTSTTSGVQVSLPYTENINKIISFKSFIRGVGYVLDGNFSYANATDNTKSHYSCTWIQTSDKTIRNMTTSSSGLYLNKPIDVIVEYTKN